MKKELKDNIKILHITRNFLPTVGGVQEYIYQVSKRSIERGFRCKVLALNYNTANRNERFSSYENIEGIEVHRIPGIGHYKKPVPLKLPLYLFKWADIIHIHDFRLLYETSTLFKKILNYKIVLSSHGFILHTEQLKLIKNILIPLYYRPSVRRYMDYVICDSKQDFSYFLSWRLNNLKLIENGIDFKVCNKSKKSMNRGRLLYFGRIDINKGIDLLLKVLSDIKDSIWFLDIAGTGQEKVVLRLKELARKLGIEKNICFHGRIDNDGLSKLLSRAEYCFFPSLYEGFGFSLLEAMATGTVCIANDIPAYRNIIEDNISGFLIDFTNRVLAKERIKGIFNIGNSKKEEISEEAMKKARCYDWDVKIPLIEEIYRNILD